MRAFLQKHLGTVPWTFDKLTKGIFQCSDRRYRADCWLEMDSHILVIECDEWQHQDYNVTCELRRIVELHSSRNGKPLTMNRWNPDDFGLNGKQQEMSEQRRLTALKKATASAIEWQPDQLLTVKDMFYDDDRELMLTSQLEEAM
ncbi:hypothetical protein WJX84_000367 [Apatococcus fuscideae]|uniref:DUF559 domain-containing protein n=1 Tax=Apatococcus fuscideae TaxID=2026836 RepID=A0AAW1ST19_9CHLO